MYSIFSLLKKNKKNDINNENNTNKLELLQECSLCFENKKLHNFCNNHKFCINCCKNWFEKNSFCPVCRSLCSNKKFMKYNYTLQNVDYENLEMYNFDLLFQCWHRQSCIRNKHSFIIRHFIKKNQKINPKKIILFCKQCNIEEDFTISL